MEGIPLSKPEAATYTPRIPLPHSVAHPSLLVFQRPATALVSPTPQFPHPASHPVPTPCAPLKQSSSRAGSCTGSEASGGGLAPRAAATWRERCSALSGTGVVPSCALLALWGEGHRGSFQALLRGQCGHPCKWGWKCCGVILSRLRAGKGNGVRFLIVLDGLRVASPRSWRLRS